MSWWSERKRQAKEAETASLVSAMATAFAQALGSVLTAQTAQIQQQSAFLGTLQDLSARKAAQVLGSRGGVSTQRKRAKAKGFACPLCENPNRRGVTLEMLNFHRAHEPEPTNRALAAPQSAEATQDERGN